MSFLSRPILSWPSPRGSPSPLSTSVEVTSRLAEWSAGSRHREIQEREAAWPSLRDSSGTSRGGRWFKQACREEGVVQQIGVEGRREGSPMREPPPREGPSLPPPATSERSRGKRWKTHGMGKTRGRPRYRKHRGK